MIELLQRAIAEMEKLPSAQQDAIASRIIADLEGEREWAVRFEATTDEQWERMVEAIRGEIAAGNTTPLDTQYQVRSRTEEESGLHSGSSTSQGCS